MERLIEKKENGRFSYYVPIAENITVKMANKLGKFEDFMEEQGFESLEELKNTVSNIEKLMLISAKITNLEQENQALKVRWEYLKEWVKNKMETCPNEEWYDFEEVFCEMKELEEMFCEMQKLEV